MRVIVKVLMFVVLAAILLSASAPATGEFPSIKTAIIHGYVYTQHNRPVPNAAVCLYDPDSYEEKCSAYTDDTGYYSMTILTGSITCVLSVGGFGAGSAILYPYTVYGGNTYEQNIIIQSAAKNIEVTTSKTSIIPDGSDTASINVHLTDMFGDEPSATANKIVFTVTNSNYDGNTDGVFESSHQKSYTVTGTSANVRFGNIDPATALDQVSIDIEAQYNQQTLARDWGYVPTASKSINFNVIDNSPTPTPTPVPTVNTPVPSTAAQASASPSAGPSPATTPGVSTSPTISPSPASVTPSPSAGPSPGGASTTPDPGLVVKNTSNDGKSTDAGPDGIVVALLAVIVILFLAVAVMGGYIYGKGKK